MTTGTAQGYTWHATCSIGFSIAEASNFINNGMGLTVRETTKMDSELHKMAEQACQQHPQLSEDPVSIKRQMPCVQHDHIFPKVSMKIGKTPLPNLNSRPLIFTRTLPWSW